jgi:hypothetical protein
MCTNRKTVQSDVRIRRGFIMVAIGICDLGIITTIISITDLDWWFWHLPDLISCILDNVTFPLGTTVPASFLEEGLITFFKGYAEMIWRLLGW